MSEYRPIVTDSDGLAVDYRRLAERIFVESESGDPSVLGDLIIAGKADIDALKRRYKEYRKEAKATTVRSPSDPTPFEQFLGAIR